MNARLALSHALNTHPEREHPDYWRPEPADAAMPFDSDWADAWIRGLANYADPEMYLARDGIELGPHADEIAWLLQEMAIAYRDKPGALADLIGSRYFRTMKQMAAVAYNNQ
jgi:hypothetical protein